MSDPTWVHLQVARQPRSRSLNLSTAESVAAVHHHFHGNASEHCPIRNAEQAHSAFLVRRRVATASLRTSPDHCDRCVVEPVSFRSVPGTNRLHSFTQLAYHLVAHSFRRTLHQIGGVVADVPGDV